MYVERKGFSLTPLYNTLSDATLFLLSSIKSQGTMDESNTSGFICLMIACNCQLYEWNFSFSFLILNLDLFCIENCHHLFQTSSYKSHNIDC